jgi:CBS domain-containing protein
VGYDIIARFLQGNAALNLILGVLIVKSLIWSISLGSGTSGGVLAPLLMIGGALGGLETQFLPAVGPGFWPLVSMAAMLGGGLRLPFTAIVFCLEVTHDLNALLPLLCSVTFAYGFTVLTMRRSILTEKIARRGYHMRAESESDPLERFFVKDVMRTGVVALPADLPVQRFGVSIADGTQRGQLLFPVLDSDKRLVGVVTRNSIRDAMAAAAPGSSQTLAEVAQPNPVTVFPKELLRSVAYRMANSGLTRLLVVEKDDPLKLVGIISWTDLLQGRLRHYEEEHTRERVLPIRLFRPSARGRTRKVS